VLTLTITSKPDAGKVALGLVQWSHLIDDYRPAFSDIRHVYDRHQRQHFDTEGGSTGEKWPDNWEPDVPWLPWRQQYPVWKKALLGDTKTLVFTGRLREAATGGQGALKRETKTSMEMGVDLSAVPYAEDHHLGNLVASALFQREVQLKRRPVIRFDGRPLRGKGTAFDGRGSTSFGYATRQIIQAHIIRALKESIGLDTGAADATIARLRGTDTR
jgi:hypothetical protein